MRDKRFKALLVKQAALQAGQRVLDCGCGTGTLTVMLKKACPGAGVVGLDVDGDVLAIARSKAAAEGLNIDFKEATATDPPFATESFDCALSSLLFHHLRPEEKRRTLDKVFALLKPGAEFHVADWGRPHDAVMRAAFLIVQMLDGIETTVDSVAGLLPDYMRATGFVAVTETQRERTLFGTLAFYRAVKPARTATRASTSPDHAVQFGRPGTYRSRFPTPAPIRLITHGSRPLANAKAPTLRRLPLMHHGNGSCGSSPLVVTTRHNGRRSGAGGCCFP